MLRMCWHFKEGRRYSSLNVHKFCLDVTMPAAGLSFWICIKALPLTLILRSWFWIYIKALPLTLILTQLVMQCKACLPPGGELAALASPFVESAAAAREAGGAAPLARTASTEGDHPAWAPAEPPASNSSKGAAGQVCIVENTLMRVTHCASFCFREFTGNLRLPPARRSHDSCIGDVCCMCSCAGAFVCQPGHSLNSGSAHQHSGKLNGHHHLSGFALVNMYRCC